MVRARPKAERPTNRRLTWRGRSATGVPAILFTPGAWTSATSHLCRPLAAWSVLFNRFHLPLLLPSQTRQHKHKAQHLFQPNSASPRRTPPGAWPQSVAHFLATLRRSSLPSAWLRWLESWVDLDPSILIAPRLETRLQISNCPITDHTAKSIEVLALSYRGIHLQPRP